MILADMMAPDGQIFFKSECGPIDDNWPCVSYTSRRTQTFLQRSFGEGDVLLYVGTQDPKSTRDKNHRKKLLSALNLDPKHTFPTAEGITAESWARSQQENEGKFGLSLKVTRAANFVVGEQGLPDASEVSPGSYRKLGRIPLRLISALPEDYAALKNLRVREFFLKAPEGSNASNFMQPSDKLAVEIARMIASIFGRVSQSGKMVERQAPMRIAAQDLDECIRALYFSQAQRCALCQGQLLLDAANPMLKMSVDRIDSSNCEYAAGNIHLTHLACNLAKNQCSTAQFDEWLTFVLPGHPRA